MKTAIIGIGRMGRRHIQVVKDLGFTLAGICDLNPQVLSLAAEEYNIPKDLHFCQARDLLNQQKPECVIIATTAPTHCEYACMAAEAGAKQILCEKPMAVSLAECDKMVEVCKKNGTKLAINHQMRFMEQYTKVKDIIITDDFGGLSSITVVAGNFGMAMNGTHYFEMFRYMTGEEPVEVTAWFYKSAIPNPRGTQFEDRAGAVRLTTASGKRFYMEIGDDQGHGLKVVYAGPYGQLIVDELAGNMSFNIREKQYRDLPTTRYGMPGITRSENISPADVIGPSKAVLQALINNENYPTGENGRLTVAILVAAYVSDENGHIPVRIDGGDLPLKRIFPWA